jgi:hypothetical protein
VDLQLDQSFGVQQEAQEQQPQTKPALSRNQRSKMTKEQVDAYYSDPVSATPEKKDKKQKKQSSKKKDLQSREQLMASARAGDYDHLGEY